MTNNWSRQITLKIGNQLAVLGINLFMIWYPVKVPYAFFSQKFKFSKGKFLYTVMKRKINEKNKKIKLNRLGFGMVGY